MDHSGHKANTAGSTSSPPPDTNYSFVVQPSPSLLQESPLKFDTPANPKQRRRRTSPRDHAILEAAYQKNSKPDKQERANIVGQVNLGEKEVQIWFQNRRQNDRRRSKPLQPHELLAHMRKGDPLSGSHPSTATDPQLQFERQSSNAALQPPLYDLPRPSSRSSSIHELLNPPSSAESGVAKDDTSIHSSRTELLSTPPSSYDDSNKVAEADVAAPPLTQPKDNASTKTTNHSRKRSHDMMLKPSEGVEPPQQLEASAPHQPTPLLRSSSFVRLAMTVDGAVKVRTNDETTPSPPKQRAPPPNLSEKKRESLGRSRSAVDNAFEFKDINPPIRRVGGAGFGRSRDARTWEFYCDRDAGEALSTQAEAERNGSAIGAINLIRSQSQRNKSHALSPNLARQNTRRTMGDVGHGKPGLPRARSSMARLQNLDGQRDLSESKPKRARHERSASGDSDKENWAPGTRASHHSLRRTQPSALHGYVLQDNDAGASQMQPSETSRDGRESKVPAVKEKAKAKGDDLDCIQGLLSLSQGAWR